METVTLTLPLKAMNMINPINISGVTDGVIAGVTAAVISGA